MYEYIFLKIKMKKVCDSILHDCDTIVLTKISS